MRYAARVTVGSLQCPQCGAVATSDAAQCAYCKARLATVACPSCFGMVFLGAAHCSHCGTAIAREAAPAAGARSCPRCERPLETTLIGEAFLDECPSCHGLWVDAASFEKITTSREHQAVVLTLGDATPRAAEAEAPGGVRYIPCPSCARLMNRLNFAHCSGVIVDLCKEHGVWFDRDELRRIVEFIRDGGLELARKRELDALVEERQKIESARREAAIQEARIHMVRDHRLAAIGISRSLAAFLFRR